MTPTVSAAQSHPPRGWGLLRLELGTPLPIPGNVNPATAADPDMVDRMARPDSTSGPVQIAMITLFIPFVPRHSQGSR